MRRTKSKERTLRSEGNRSEGRHSLRKAGCRVAYLVNILPAPPPLVRGFVGCSFLDFWSFLEAFLVAILFLLFLVFDAPKLDRSFDERGELATFRLRRSHSIYV